MKDKFNRDIDVPEADVRLAIRKGIQRAKAEEPVKKKSRKSYKIFFSVAAACLLALTFFINPVAKALANVPIIGSVYSQFNDLVGRDLEGRDLVTALDELAEAEDIQIKITSGYYDGAMIGITFDITGEVLANESEEMDGFYEIFNGDEEIADSQELVYLQKNEKGYSGHIRHYYPATDLPEGAEIPLAFKRIGKYEGNWEFDVAIKQLPYKEVALTEERIDEEHQIMIEFESIMIGEASVAIDYTATFPKNQENNQASLAIFDDNGNEIYGLIDGIDLEKTVDGDSVIVKNRTIITDSIEGTINSLTIHPKVRIIGENPNQPLELEALQIPLK